MFHQHKMTHRQRPCELSSATLSSVRILRPVTHFSAMEKLFRFVEYESEGERVENSKCSNSL